MIGLLVEATIRTMVLVAVVWIILRSIRLRDLRAEKLIWTIVVAASLAMPLVLRTIPVPLFSQPNSLMITGRIAALGARAHSFSVWRILLLGYWLITSILLIRFTRGIWVAARICRAARKISGPWAGSFDIRVSRQVRAPSSFGRIILLPCEWAQWTPETLRAVIAHEGAHIRDYDHYRMWLASVYCAVGWFNPSALWLRRRLNLLAEHLSDEAGVAELGDRISYAQLLVNLAAGPQPPAPTLSMAAPATLTQRLKRLLETDMSSRTIGRTFRLILLGTIAVAATTATFADSAPLVLTLQQDSMVSWVSGDPLSKFYPEALVKQGIQGWVTCRLTIDAAGDVIDAVAVKETPADSGLALAAVEAAKTFHFTNTLSRPVVKVMAMKFELSRS